MEAPILSVGKVLVWDFLETVSAFLPMMNARVQSKQAKAMKETPGFAFATIQIRNRWHQRIPADRDTHNVRFLIHSDLDGDMLPGTQVWAAS
jgi:hypothetical protein